ncbi:preprotein translocase subunit SecE [Patescibacteria group bacterium]|nr:preprotein translocase subunit SecE [Patescibacteria group bacterium]
MANKLISYFKESKDELKKVIWPSRSETIKYTLLVMAISVGMAIFLGILDFGLDKVVEQVFR